MIGMEENHDMKAECNGLRGYEEDQDVSPAKRPKLLAADDDDEKEPFDKEEHNGTLTTTAFTDPLSSTPTYTCTDGTLQNEIEEPPEKDVNNTIGSSSISEEGANCDGDGDPPSSPKIKPEVNETQPSTSSQPVNKKKKKKKKLKGKAGDTKKEDEDEASSSSKADEALKKARRKAANLRKNIKDILTTESLGEETLAAQREELERRERMNLKLQQLRMMQQQQQQQQSSYPAEPDLLDGISMPNCFDDLFTSILEEDGTEPQPDLKLTTEDLLTEEVLPPHPSSSTIVQEQEMQLVQQPEVPSIPSGSSLTPPPQQKEDFVVLSSDDEEESKANEEQKIKLLQQQLRSRLVQSHFYPQISSAKHQLLRSNEENVISLSSDEDDDDNVRTANKVKDKAANNTTILQSSKGDESDDDCVMLSPPPEPEDDEKDERQMDELNVPDGEGRVLVNVGHPEEDPDIFLAPQVARIVKPHQIGGIRFLYDNVVESLDRFNTASGFGCILAHSMGLGKTLQAVSFCDVFLRTGRAKTVLIIVPINTIQNWYNEFNQWLPPGKKSNSDSEGKKKSSSATNNNKKTPPPPVNLSTAPSTPLNTAEQSCSSTISDSICETVSLNLSFDSTLNLLPDSSGAEASSSDPQPSPPEESPPEGEIHPRKFDVFVLNETVKTLQMRERIIKDWSTRGGVMLIGYEMYRMLALKKLKKSKKNSTPTPFNNGVEVSSEMNSLNNIHACLVDPGPDLVICDEGHRIKNSGASISQALKAIRTKRRVVLTGYPLQNNLIEYWCMVDFIRPNYLGSKMDFSNMFERPITNGQCIDSTPADKKLMRYRSHVLHSLLEGFVQRRSHAVFRNALPEKQEWVFLLKMTTVQLDLYKAFIHYLSSNVDVENPGGAGANPIKAFAVCCKIWNHPDALYNVLKRKQSILDDLDLDEMEGRNNGGGEGTKGSGGGRGARGNKKGKDSQIAFFDGSGFDFRKSSSCNSSAARSASASEALSLDWATSIFENYVPGVLENGAKFEVLFDIIKETVAMKDRILVFSQTLLSLDLLESFLHQKFGWIKNSEYYRLDGSTTGLEREKLVRNFNSKKEVVLFLVSTRAGSLGINLTGANRVVVLDASWNPCHDGQAVCRVYRYGQTKPCQIYRFVSDLTLEKRIYDRQINKRGMSDRVVDEMNPNAQFKSKDVSSFLVLKHEHLDKLNYIKCNVNPEKYGDPVMQKILIKNGERLTQEPFEHESLLTDQKHQRLSATEKRLAHRNYLSEKKTVELQAASGFTYSRPSYAAYYPREPNSSHNHPPMGGGRGIAPLATRNPSALLSSLRSLPPQEDTFERHVPALRAKGICVQSIVLKKDAFLADPGGGHSPDMFLMAGERIYVLRSEKGTYLRISNGKLIAVRNNSTQSRYTILNIPTSQDLTKEQLQTLVFSFLKMPSGSHSGRGRPPSSFGSQQGFPSFNNLPKEQPLPPSPSFFSHGKNHLQVTNPRSNSGGDVTMWPNNSSEGQGQSRTNLQQPRRPPPPTLAALLDSNSNSSSSNLSCSSGFNALNSSTTQTNLQKLQFLARMTAAQGKYPNFPNLSSPYGHPPTSPFESSDSFPPTPGGGVGGANTTNDEVELIPISPSPSGSNGNSKSGGSLNNHHNHTPHPSTFFPTSSSSYNHRYSPSSSALLEGQQNSNSSSLPPTGPGGPSSFYQDFTITVKPNSTSRGGGNNENSNSSSSQSPSLMNPNLTGTTPPQIPTTFTPYLQNELSKMMLTSTNNHQNLPSIFNNHHQYYSNNNIDNSSSSNIHPQQIISDSNPLSPTSPKQDVLGIPNSFSYNKGI